MSRAEEGNGEMGGGGGGRGERSEEISEKEGRLVERRERRAEMGNE